MLMTEEKKMIYKIDPIRKKEPGEIGIRVRLEAYDPCPIHAPTPCDCPKKCVGVVEKGDICLKQLAQLFQINLLNTGGATVTDTSNAGHVVSANTAVTAVQIVAGTDSTSPAYNDYHLIAAVDSPVTGTVGAVSGSGTTTLFHITGSVTAGSSRTYKEVGLQITVNSNIYMLCRDVFNGTTGLAVASSGTLAVDYLISFS